MYLKEVDILLKEQITKTIFTTSFFGGPVLVPFEWGI